MRLTTIFSAFLASAWAQSTVPQYSAISSALFNQLKAAAGVGWTYSEDGCTEKAILDRNPDGPARWEQLNTFSIKDGDGGDIIVRIFRKTATNVKELYLFFPGTKANSNWATNTNLNLIPYTFNGACGGCRVHEGFLKAFQGGQNAIEFNVRYYKGQYPDHKIVIAGGSLGGGLAAIAFAEFKTKSSAQIDVDRAITFGQPRVGNQDWANFMNYITVANAGASSKFFRVTHGYDFFVRVPPPINGWVHHGGEIWAEDSAINNNRPVAATTKVCPVKNNNAENYDCAQKPSQGSGNPGDHTTYPGYGFGYEQAVCKYAPP